MFNPFIHSGVLIRLHSNKYFETFANAKSNVLSTFPYFQIKREPGTTCRDGDIDQKASPSTFAERKGREHVYMGVYQMTGMPFYYPLKIDNRLHIILYRLYDDLKYENILQYIVK